MSIENDEELVRLRIRNSQLELACEMFEQSSALSLKDATAAESERDHLCKVLAEVIMMTKHLGYALQKISILATVDDAGVSWNDLLNIVALANQAFKLEPFVGDQTIGGV